MSQSQAKESIFPRKRREAINFADFCTDPEDLFPYNCSEPKAEMVQAFDEVKEVKSSLDN